MCFELVAHRATKEVVCYKRFKVYKGRYITPYQKYVWPKTGVVKATMKGRFESWQLSGGGRLVINDGLHAYMRKETAESYKCTGEVVRKMIIPWGGRYFVDAYGNTLVANEMEMVVKTLPRKTVKELLKKKKKKTNKKDASNTNSSNRKTRKR